MTRPQMSLSDLAYSRIRQAIIRAELRPGDVVTEAGLAASFELGKAPLRAALHRLAQEGLVVPRRRYGHEISPITLQYIEDLFDVRILLEVEAARLCAGRIDLDFL